MQNVIEFEKVGVRFGGRDLFSGVELKLSSGSFHFLTGASGAGKTTLVRLCYGAAAASDGIVRLFGTDSRAMNREDLADLRLRIGIVHQNCSFLDHLTVAENVALPLEVTGTMTPQRKRELTDLLRWVGLSRRADARPAELSGGERQRAALARAVIVDPEVILADEPTGNIDWDMSLRLFSLLAELNRMGKTILMATHDMALIRAARGTVSARVLRLADARLTVAGADL